MCSSDLRDALAVMYRTGQDDFPVVEQDRLVGLLTRQSVIDAIREGGEEIRVAEVMDTDPPVLSPRNKVSWVHEQMMAEHYQGFPVLEDGRLVGLFGPDHISRYLLLQESLRARRRGRAPSPRPPAVIAAVPPTATPPPPAESVPPPGRA